MNSIRKWKFIISIFDAYNVPSIKYKNKYEIIEKIIPSHVFLVTIGVIFVRKGVLVNFNQSEFIVHCIVFFICVYKLSFEHFFNVIYGRGNALYYCGIDNDKWKPSHCGRHTVSQATNSKQ